MDIKPYLSHPLFSGLSMHRTYLRAVEAAQDFAKLHGGKVNVKSAIVSLPAGGKMRFVETTPDMRLRLMSLTFHYVVAEPKVPFGEVVYARLLLRKPLEGLPNVLVSLQ